MKAMTVESVITELVRKECDAYQLVDLGLLPSVDEGVSLLLPEFGKVDRVVLDDFARFCVWRREMLQFFYKQLEYGLFVRNAGESASFRRFLFTLKRRIAGILYERCDEPTIDRELAVPGKTLAFKWSGMLDDEWFQSGRMDLLTVETPALLEEKCWGYCRDFFPIDMGKLKVRLEKNDPEFWDDLSLTIKKIADVVTSGRLVSIQYKKEIAQDVWTDTFFLLNRKMVSKCVPLFETALHFRHYIARICLNKCREAIRKYYHPDMTLTVTGEMPSDIMEEEDVDIVGRDYGVSAINCDDEDEVRRCLTIVLLDKLEPWYSELTKGIEDKIELVFLRYVEGLSYDEIANLKDADASQEARPRLSNRMRQTVVRTRRLLKQRFVELLKR